MFNKRYKDKNWLYEKHVEQGLTNVEIADMCGVSDATISQLQETGGLIVSNIRQR